MSKRTWTPEQRAAFGAKMKAAKEAKRQQAVIEEKLERDGMIAKDAVTTPQEEPMPKPENMPEPEPQAPMPAVTLTNEQFQMMLQAFQSQEGTKKSSPAVVNQAMQGTQLGPQGQVIGVVERFPIDPKYYKNPTEELYDMPEFSRHAMRYNFVLDWTCTPVKYQTAMGTWYMEPRFELTLKKKQLDEDGNELVKVDPATGKEFHPRIVLGRASFFEDPPANILEAEEAGVALEDLDKGEFQEKMRMYRYKFWLSEKLSPKRPVTTTNRKRMEVIGGKAYEIEEFSKPL